MQRDLHSVLAKGSIITFLVLALPSLRACVDWWNLEVKAREGIRGYSGCALLTNSEG